jgi:hypothetical protein
VSNAFYDRQVFTTDFWGALSEELRKVRTKSRNSITNLFMSLGQGDRREQQEKYIR